MVLGPGDYSPVSNVTLFLDCVTCLLSFLSRETKIVSRLFFLQYVPQHDNEEEEDIES